MARASDSASSLGTTPTSSPNTPCSSTPPGLSDETTGVPEAKQMISTLVSGHEAVARTARKIFPEVEKASDEPTADLLTQRLQVHEKTAWMLRSLLEA